MPGTSQEYGGIIKHGAKLLYAYAECTVPKVTVITRQSLWGAPMTLWRLSTCAEMPIWHGLRQKLQLWAPRARLKLFSAKDIGDEEKIAARTEEYRKKFANPFIAGKRGYIDDVIMPHSTRKRVARSLAMLRNKSVENPWRKHGNIPLLNN